MSTVKYLDENGLATVWNKVKGIIPDAVEANPTVPSGTTPTSLSGLKIGASYYNVASGGGTITDVTVGGASVVNNNGVAVVPEIPTVPDISTNISSDAASDTKTASPKAVKTYVDAHMTNISAVSTQQDGTIVITLSNGDTITVDLNHNHEQYYSKAVETSQPAGGFAPDVVYNLGTLTGAVTFALAASISGNVNHYYWAFDTSSTAPTITWPSSNFAWADGTGPTVAASKHYEVSVLNGIATFLEV